MHESMVEHLHETSSSRQHVSVTAPGDGFREVDFIIGMFFGRYSSNVIIIWKSHCDPYCIRRMQTKCQRQVTGAIALHNCNFWKVAFTQLNSKNRWQLCSIGWFLVSIGTVSTGCISYYSFVSLGTSTMTEGRCVYGFSAAALQARQADIQYLN